MSQLEVTFINEICRKFYNETKRNICISGGFGSGKTTISLLKLILLLTNFNYYRAVIGREQYKALLQTTFKTFTKLMPERFIERWNEQTGYMKLVNRSEILWMHCDAIDEAAVKGLEVNSVFLDQPEEVAESAYNLLDARVNRWDQATPCEALLRANPNWPRHPLTNKYMIPGYMLLSPNPDTELHWIYQKYHPDSPYSKTFSDTHAYYEVSSRDNPFLDRENLATMLTRDKSWVERFVDGKWGISEAAIHHISKASRISPSKQWIDNLLKRSNLLRALDHGDAAPTCCLWIARFQKQFFAYREYYQPYKLIKEHRQAIYDLSLGEDYVYSLADPEIFKKKSQNNKAGTFWSVAEEYADPTIEAPSLIWYPADNNEMATRNRINELLALDLKQKHPITGESPAPGIYFIERNPQEHNYGVQNVILETGSQKRKSVGELNGKIIYADIRDDKIPDHSYDPFRYIIAYHLQERHFRNNKPGPQSFEGVRKRLIMEKIIANRRTKGERFGYNA